MRLPPQKPWRRALTALLSTALLPVASGCADRAAGGTPEVEAHGLQAPEVSPRALEAPDRADRLRHLLGILAADSMEGRATGTRGAERASAFLAAALERAGALPAIGGSYLQPVPLLRTPTGFALPDPSVDPDTLDPRLLVRNAANVIGLIPGTDPDLAREAVVIGAHYDHLGFGPPVDGDSIYNGADDDGTGTVAILEIARDLAQGPPPRRTVVVLLSAAEEDGLLGTWWYLRHPVHPLERTVADLQIEMIGRPDPLAGGPGRGWLTGYERSTVGDQLAAEGSPIVPDPRPQMQFFFRSDNLPFALEGIPAHTLSSYNLHEDYHRPSDEIERIDFTHMATLVDAASRMVRLLADGPAPAWKPGGRDGLEQLRHR